MPSSGVKLMKWPLASALCLTLCITTFAPSKPSKGMSEAQSRPSRKTPEGDSPQPMWVRLLKYEGRDLRKLGQRDSIQLYRILDAILPGNHPQHPTELFSYYFFRKMQLPQNLV